VFTKKISNRRGVKEIQCRAKNRTLRYTTIKLESFGRGTIKLCSIGEVGSEPGKSVTTDSIDLSKVPLTISIGAI
jgi:hypothetical protein